MRWLPRQQAHTPDGICCSGVAERMQLKECAAQELPGNRPLAAGQICSLLLLALTRVDSVGARSVRIVEERGEAGDEGIFLSPLPVVSRALFQSDGLLYARPWCAVPETLLCLTVPDCLAQVHVLQMSLRPTPSAVYCFTRLAPCRPAGRGWLQQRRSEDHVLRAVLRPNFIVLSQPARYWYAL